MRFRLGLLSLGCAICLASALAGESLFFQKTTVTKLAAGNVHMTRAQLSGFVTYVKKEADGDVHVRVCDSVSVKGMDLKHCIAAEIMPQIPLAVPKVGSQVTVQGITRFDGEHKFWELHPVTSIR